LRSIPKGETFERVLDDLQGESESDPQRKSQIMAIRFYLQSAIARCDSSWHRQTCGNITNYVTFLDQLRRRSEDPKLLITFNYDRLIEEALLSVGIKITNISDYIKDRHFKLFKLHGSVNWGRELDQPRDIRSKEPINVAT
jgi:hypothetical protein